MDRPTDMDEVMADSEQSKDIVLSSAGAQARMGSGVVKRLSGLLSHQAGVVGTVYLLLDHSLSMADDDKMLQLKRGALRFFAEAFVRGYAIGAIAFSVQARSLIRAGRNAYLFQKNLNKLTIAGRTNMAAAVQLATKKLLRVQGQRVMVLITDGLPDSRARTLEAVLRARALGIEVIAVGTTGADEAFLASLMPKPECQVVTPGALESALAQTARALPKARPTIV